MSTKATKTEESRLIERLEKEGAKDVREFIHNLSKTYKSRPIEYLATLVHLYSALKDVDTYHYVLQKFRIASQSYLK